MEPKSTEPKEVQPNIWKKLQAGWLGRALKFVWEKLLVKLGFAGKGRPVILILIAAFEFSVIFCGGGAWVLDKLQAAIYPIPTVVQQVSGTTSDNASNAKKKCHKACRKALREARLKQQEGRNQLRNAFALFLPGLIPSFLLWGWRNADKRTDIDHSQQHLTHSRENLDQQLRTNSENSFHKWVEWLNGDNEAQAAAAAPQLVRFLESPALKDSFGAPAFRAIFSKLEHWAESKDVKAALHAREAWHELSPKERQENEKEAPQRLTPPLSIQGLHRLLWKHPQAFLDRELFWIKLPWANLVQWQFPGGKLSEADFSGADLLKANLKEASLWKAKFRWSILRSANFQGAELQQADFYRADLQGANFENANLEQAFFPRAYLQGANLQGVQAGGAEFQNANLSHAILQDAKLHNAQFPAAKLNAAKLQNAELGNANLQAAVLNVAHLEGAKLISANLQDTDLSFAQLQGATLINAKLQNADLSAAQIQGTNFQGADLREANLLACKIDEKTNFQGATIDKHTKLGGLDWKALGMVFVGDEDLESDQT